MDDDDRRASEAQDALGEATTLNHLGRVYAASHKWQEALDCFCEALRLRHEKGYRQGEAQTLRNIAAVLDSTGELPAALKYGSDALDLSRKVGDRRGEADALYTLARTYLDGGDLDEARRNIEQAIDIIEKLRGQIASHELRSSYFATAQDFYELYVGLLMVLHKHDPGGGYDSAALQVSERARAEPPRPAARVAGGHPAGRRPGAARARTLVAGATRREGRW